MDYAGVLYFDKESEIKMQAMIDKVAEETGCDYMKRVGIPPHVTVSGIWRKSRPDCIGKM